MGGPTGCSSGKNAKRLKEERNDSQKIGVNVREPREAREGTRGVFFLLIFDREKRLAREFSLKLHVRIREWCSLPSRPPKNLC